MTKSDNYTFDMVHGTQEIYRKLLDCFARPGMVQNIHHSIHNIESVHRFSPTLMGIAYTLIDREVSFHVISNEQQAVGKYLHWKTFSYQVEIENAHFIFIQEQLEDEKIKKVMKRIKLGTLEEPHNSATIILQVESLTSGERLELSGPGINQTRECLVKGLSPVWLIEREMANKEFPLGADLILTNEQGEIMAIPRTTLIESEWL